MGVLLVALLENARFDAVGPLRVHGQNPATTRYYYDGQNVIAEYTYTEPDEVPTETLARTYVTLDTPPGDAGFQRVCVGGESRVNGSQYIDERVVMRDHVGSAEAPGPRDYYYLHQELYSVAGLARANGSLAEACVYETYGQARIYSWPNEDLNRNGSADPVDLSYLSANKSGSGVATDKPYMDFDMDGDVDTDDELELDADLDGLVDASADALEVDVSPAGNPFLFTGRPTDHLRTVQVIGSIERRRIQDNRNRTYDPKHGRWLQRDPAGTSVTSAGEVQPQKQMTDGLNLYEYAKSAPTTLLDPQGLNSEREKLEWDWALNHPLCAARAKHLEAKSQKSLKEKFGASADHTPSNAIHHCQTMCKIAASCLCGPDLALELGALHEVGSPYNQLHMDMHNNKEGIACYTEEKADTWSACFSCCLRKVFDRRLHWFQATVYSKDKKWKQPWWLIFDGLPPRNPDWGWEEGI